VIEASDVVEDDFLDPVHCFGLHLDDEIINAIETVYVGDLLDASEGVDDRGFLPELSVQKNIGLHLNHETSANT